LRPPQNSPYVKISHREIRERIEKFKALLKDQTENLDSWVSEEKNVFEQKKDSRAAENAFAFPSAARLSSGLFLLF
jgi:hypothetical protein